MCGSLPLVARMVLAWSRRWSSGDVRCVWAHCRTGGHNVTYRHVGTAWADKVQEAEHLVVHGGVPQSPLEPCRHVVYLYEPFCSLRLGLLACTVAGRSALCLPSGPRRDPKEMRTTGSLLPLLLATVRACEVTVYSDNYFDTPGSREATFRDGEYNYWKFIETMENDAVSSLKVEGHNCVAVLYGGPSFDGWSATFHQGRYDLHAALAKGLHDNEVSSLRIGYGQGAGRARPQPCTHPQRQPQRQTQPLPQPPSSKPSLSPSASSSVTPRPSPSPNPTSTQATRTTAGTTRAGWTSSGTGARTTSRTVTARVATCCTTGSPRPSSASRTTTAARAAAASRNKLASARPTARTRPTGRTPSATAAMATCATASAPLRTARWCTSTGTLRRSTSSSSRTSTAAPAGSEGHAASDAEEQRPRGIDAAHSSLLRHASRSLRETCRLGVLRSLAPRRVTHVHGSHTCTCTCTCHAHGIRNTIDNVRSDLRGVRSRPSLARCWRGRVGALRTLAP